MPEQIIMAESPFDPFNFGDDDDDERLVSPATTSLAAKATIDNSGGSTSTSRTKTKDRIETAGEDVLKAATNDTDSKPLAPRLNVSLALHEEVSSSVTVDQHCDSEGGCLSSLFIEGKVIVSIDEEQRLIRSTTPLSAHDVSADPCFYCFSKARVESLNSNQNTSFRLEIDGPMALLANISCIDHRVLRENDRGTRCKIDIPMTGLESVEVLKYSMNTETQNTPILVQAKLAVKVKTCLISIQIRSNLKNKGDLSNFSIVVAIPTTIRAETVNVTRGENGAWDATKRIVTWKTKSLPHGESYLVGVEAEISSALAGLLHENQFASKIVAEKIQCPVLVRCSSDVDQVSDLVFTATALEGDTATISLNQAASYRLLHRVGKMVTK